MKQARYSNISVWLVQHNFPTGFQILCMNCNFAKGKLGTCPHQEKFQQRPSPAKATQQPVAP
jgi:hypothetical protein